MNFIGIIPARYASTRFPGKPLVNIKGKSMIQRVYERANLVLDKVVVATDDQRIFDAVKKFNGEVVMTSPTHSSGTDRCAEATELIQIASNINFDIILNIQGDEPFIRQEQLSKLMDCFQDETTQIATLIKKIECSEDVFNINKPKVIIDKNSNAIYFSRSPIPFIREKENDSWYTEHTFYKHIGLYAYRLDTLKEITNLNESPLELAEKLEQNRWIENNYKIKVAITDFESISIDTPEDLKKVEKMKIIE